MTYVVCSHCGFTADTDSFVDDDEFWSCPNCCMDESGLDIIDSSLPGATVEAGVHWPERDAEGEWGLSEDVTVEVGVLLPYGGGVKFERPIPDSLMTMPITLHNWNQVTYVKVLALPLDIPAATVQNA